MRYGRYGTSDFAAEYEVKISAPPDKVWDRLARVDLWATWRQDVSAAFWLQGEGEKGRFKWRLRKFLGQTADVTAWRPERVMRWEAQSYGAHLHYEIEMDGDYRATTVRLRISGDGGILCFFLLRHVVTRQLDRSNQIWMGALKTRLEAGKDDFTSPPHDLKNPFENNVKINPELGPFDR